AKSRLRRERAGEVCRTFVLHFAHAFPSGSRGAAGARVWWTASRSCIGVGMASGEFDAALVDGRRTTRLSEGPSLSDPREGRAFAAVSTSSNSTDAKNKVDSAARVS